MVTSRYGSRPVIVPRFLQFRSMIGTYAVSLPFTDEQANSENNARIKNNIYTCDILRLFENTVLTQGIMLR